MKCQRNFIKYPLAVVLAGVVKSITSDTFRRIVRDDFDGLGNARLHHVLEP